MDRNGARNRDDGRCVCGEIEEFIGVKGGTMRTVIFTLILAVVALGACTAAPTARTDAPTLVTEKGISEMSPAGARPGIEAAYSQFVDVRTPEEYASGHAYRAKNIPLDTLEQNLDKLERNEPVYVICETGSRSKKATDILDANGFAQVINVTGGTQAWRAAGMPMAESPTGNAP